MPKQAFNDFLNLSAGPSTPRGRGRGGGMRGGRGGGGRGGTPVSKRSYNADYTSVGFDYTAINNQGYRRMEGFSVDPFGAPTSTTPDSSSFRGRGRGRGRGGFAPHGNKHGGLGHHGQRIKHSEGSDAPQTPASAPSAPDTPSGARTPVTGLGIPRPAAGSLVRGAIGSARGKAKTPIRAMQPKQNRDGQVIWGGRGAPLFVKAGELFKDGEVDTVHPEALTEAISGEAKQLTRVTTPPTPLVPQVRPVEPEAVVMLADSEPTPVTDIAKDEEHVPSSTDTSLLVERTSEIILEVQGDGRITEKVQNAGIPIQVSIEPEASQPLETDFAVDLSASGASASPVPPSASADEESDAAFGIASAPEGPETHVSIDRFEQLDAESPDAPGAQLVAEEDLFFIDTEPSAADSGATGIQYNTLSDAPIGTTRSDSEEEQIVFKPRTFGQPKPLDVRLPPQASSIPARPPTAAAAPELSLGSVKPGRKAKKALKKEKRKMRGTGKKATKRSGFDAMEGSDIEWGSDGLPAGVFDKDVDIDDMVEDDDGDIAILKDYLAGTQLGAESDDESVDEDGIVGDAAGETADEAIAAAPGLGSKAGEALKKGRRKMRQKGWDDAPVSILDDAMNIDIDSDNANSSELGDLQAIMDALDSDDEENSDGDMEEEERLFTGKHAWTSEDEDTWFVRSMEEALSGKKPGKGKTTHTGLFGSMQNGYDDLDLPTVPKLKGKKKIEGVPEELQAQWEADRRKKAVKKEQRQIERLLADLAVAAPSSSSSKRKAKGSAKAKQASLAHLIPASAAEVADMFDVSSDDAGMSALASGMGLGRSGGRKGKGKAMMQYAELAMDGFGSARNGGGGNMNSINTGGGQGIGGLIEQIRVFVDDPHQTTHTLPPMDKEGRRKMHMLAECFDLKSKSRGMGKARFTILIKTSRTGLHIDEDSISRLVSASQFTGGHFYKAYYTNGKPNKFAQGGSGGVKSGKKGGPPGDRGNSTRARDGELVGGGADRIGQDNVGHRLLSMMGWAEGGRIGRTEGGLEQPIIAVVKNTKSGLGA